MTDATARNISNTLLLLSLIPIGLYAFTAIRQWRQRGSREDRTFLRRAYAVSAN